MMTEFAIYTVKLFNEMTHGGQACFYPVGGVEVAFTPERLAELKRKRGFARSYGLDAHLISPADVKKMIPKA